MLAGLQADTNVAERYRREGITANYSASKIFDRKSSGVGPEERTESELGGLKDVIAEITAENLELKRRWRF